VKRKKIILVIGLICIVLAAAAIFFIRILPSVKQVEMVTIDGVVLTDMNSPENRILLETEGESAAGDWRCYSDMEKEKERIDKRLDSLKSAFKSKNVNKITGFFNKPEQEYYKSFFSENKENLSEWADMFAEAEMVFLSPPGSPKSDTFYRMAEYKAVWNDMEISIVFIKEDGQWYILDL